MVDLIELMRKFSKIEGIVEYFAYRVGGEYLSKKRLMKLYYMAEIESIQHNAKRLSDADFHNWDHGMFSIDVMKGLELSDNIRTVEGTDSEYPGKRLEWSGGKLKIDLSKEEKEVLDVVIKKWGRKKTDEITEKAKSKPPFTWTSYGDSVDFDSYAKIYEETYSDEELLFFINKSREEIAQGKCLSIDTEADLERYISTLP